MKWNELPTPCYVVDQKKLKENLIILHNLEQDTGCHVLLAQKAFSTYALYPLIGQYISGTTASGLYEARLGAEEMGRENMCLLRRTRTAIWRNWSRSATM